MRSKDSLLKEKIYAFVNDWIRDHGRSPSLGAVAGGLGVSRTTVYRYLVAMTDEGTGLVYDGKTIETREFNNYNMRLSPTKIVGEIPCGEAQEEEEYVEDYINLPASIFGSGEFYVLRAAGDSMEDAGIKEGDMVVILRQPEARKGDIVVALDDEGKNTLKRYGGKDKRGNYTLEYMNEAIYPGRKILVKEFVVQGVACHVIKSLR